MRSRTVFLPAFAVGLLWIAGSAIAQEPSPSHIAAARELVSAAGASNSIDRIMPALTDEMRKQITTRPEMTKDLDEVLKAMAPELEQQRQQAYFVAARSYAKWLSEGEIRDAVTFFRSPAGLKYVQAQADITSDLVSTVGAWSQLAAEYVQTRVRSEMLKRGHQLQ